MPAFNPLLGVMDAANLSFAVSQAAHVESEVLRRVYPEVTYARDIPIDTSANPFAATITFFSMDQVGNAKLINGHGDDIPLANVDINKFDASVRMGGIAYSFSLEELGQAQMAGINLDSEGAASARFAYEKFVDGAAYLGTGMPAGTTGLYNNASVTTIAATGVFSSLTNDQIIDNVNTLLGGVYTSSLMTEVTDTLRLPPGVFSLLVSRRLGVDSTMNLLEYIRAQNIYTATTGQPLDIRGDKFLTTTACAYRRDPSVVKLHIPMPLRFLPVQPRNVEYYVPGMFRLAGTDVRRPGAMRYMSGVA